MSDNFLRVDMLASRIAERILENHVGPATAKLLAPVIRREARRLRRFNPRREHVEAAREILERTRAR